jgi:prophage regulatory protein
MPTSKNFRHEIIRMRETCKLCGVSRFTIYRLVQDGDFPTPIRITPRCFGWKRGEILDWMESRRDPSVIPSIPPADQAQ